MSRFHIKNPLAKKPKVSSGTIFYQHPTMYVGREPADALSEPEPETVTHHRRRGYWLALTSVAAAAILLLMLVTGLPSGQTAGIKFFLGFGFICFSVLSIHFVISALRAEELGGDFTPGRRRW
jgi:hypothetical protein